MTTTHLRLWFAWVALAALILAPVPATFASFEGQQTERMISHVFGVISLMCMALSMVITARPFGVDSLFSGLDKAYVVHKWLGLIAFATLLIHDTLESEVDGLKSEVRFLEIDWHDLGSEMGVWVYNGLLVLLAATFLTRIPYRWWFWTHRFMVVMYLLSVTHFIVIPKPMMLNNPGSLYVLGWCFAGFLAVVLSLRPMAARGGLPYRATEVIRNDHNFVLRLAPKGARKLRHKAGQFITLRGEGEGLNEWHPFTVSSAPSDDGNIELTIAIRDRWTRTLAAKAEIGADFRLRGPHGQFFPVRHKGRQIWLSGGIGITPYLAWARSDFAPKGEVEILHICRDRTDVPQLNALESYAAKHENVTLKIHETRDRGRPNSRDLMRLMRDRSETVDVFYCGPAGLREVLNAAAKSTRKAKFNLYQETFAIRTGLPSPQWWRDAFRILLDAARETLAQRRAR